MAGPRHCDMARSCAFIHLASR